MGRLCFSFKLCMSISFVSFLLYVTCNMKPRGETPYVNNGGRERTGASFKTNGVNGQTQIYRTTSNGTASNGNGGYKEDSAFPDETSDPDVGEEETVASRKIETYFSALSATFSDVPIGHNDSVDTLPFLAACLATTQLFEKMRKIILNKVVQDIRSNVEKIQWNYDLDPERSKTLQDMVLQDLALDLPEDEYEGTTLLALTWLKRAFAFISRFLSYINAGEEQTDSARKAYAETLREYHGFVTRTVFNTAFRTLSSRSAFLRDLAVNEADVGRPDFEEIAMNDLRDYNSALIKRLEVLENFFNQHDIMN